MPYNTENLVSCPAGNVNVYCRSAAQTVAYTGMDRITVNLLHDEQVENRMTGLRGSSTFSATIEAPVILQIPAFQCTAAD